MWTNCPGQLWAGSGLESAYPGSMSLPFHALHLSLTPRIIINMNYVSLRFSYIISWRLYQCRIDCNRNKATIKTNKQQHRTLLGKLSYLHFSYKIFFSYLFIDQVLLCKGGGADLILSHGYYFKKN